MILPLLAILIVFFAFGAKSSMDYLAARAAFAMTKDKRNNTGILILMIYLNLWIIEEVIALFNNFNMGLLISVAATELIMYGLSYLTVLVMSLFSRSESKYITIPMAFVCSFFSITIINAVLTFLHSMIGLIIV